MITLPRKVTTWVMGTDFGRQVFQFAADTFDALKSLRTAVEELRSDVENIDVSGGTPGAHAATHLPVSGSDPLTVGTGADTFCVGNDARLSDDRTASGLRTASSVVTISAATAPSAGQLLVAQSSTLANWRGTTSFSWSSSAASLDLSTSLDFSASNDLSSNSVLTLTNGADGRKGRIYVKQDGTGGWTINFVVSGRTLLFNEGELDAFPQSTADSHTVYFYDFQTIDGVACCIIQKFGLALAAPLLDRLSITPLAAFSTYRKLRTAYAGSAFRVRRSSDNAEQDIGFAGTLVDAASLLSFVGANDGFVVTLYDQTAAGRNLSNATAANQPRVVNAGAIESLNGKLAMRFDGTNDILERADACSISGDESFTQCFTAQAAANTATQRWTHVGGDGSADDYVMTGPNGTDTSIHWDKFGGLQAVGGAQSILSPRTYTYSHDSAANQGNVRQNGTSLSTFAVTPTYNNLYTVLGGIQTGGGPSNFAQVKMNFWLLTDSTLLTGSNLVQLNHIEAEALEHI